MISDNLEKIKIDISENNDNITCRVEIAPRDRFCSYKIAIDTKTLASYLKNQGYKFISNSAPHKKINNYQQGISNKWTWEFKKEKKPTPKRRTTRKKTQIEK